MNRAIWSSRLAAMRDTVRRDPAVWSLVLVMAVIYLALAGRYDAFRNELYFIVCGRHPAFGYVDLPPLVPLIAAATQLAGNSTWLLRVPAIVVALALIPLTAALCRLLGGGRTAAWIAALAVAVAPMLIGVQATLSTSAFEPLTDPVRLSNRARNDPGRPHGGVMGRCGGRPVARSQVRYRYLVDWARHRDARKRRPARHFLARVMVRRSHWRTHRGSKSYLASAQWMAILEAIHFAATHRNLTGAPLRFVGGQFGHESIAGAAVDRWSGSTIRRCAIA